MQSYSDFLNTIHYAVAKQMVDKLLAKNLITQEEYENIDALNKKSFHQNLITKNNRNFSG